MNERCRGAGEADRWFVFAAALAAASLSWAYIAVFLRGGPRIIDATSYFLEARAMSQGLVSWAPDAPLASVAGRFLVGNATDAGSSIAVIFPPGYPAILSVGFWLGVPLAIGPLLGAALAWATFDLARVAMADAPPEVRRLCARAAVLSSVVCATLRYHTADTMSHGLAALCFTVGLSFTMRPPRVRTAIATGIAFSLLAASRPTSALALGACIAAILVARRRPPGLGWLAVSGLSSLPMLGLLAAHQWAATGAPWTSTQLAYYAQSDGPPGCFRYGFGDGVGCLYEHGDFVRHNLPDGYGAYEVAATTLRRLEMHLADAGNAEPLFLLVLAGIWIGWRWRPIRMLAFALGAQIAVVAPFYFDGNYPGGGARLLADVLPVEHVLAGVAISALALRAGQARETTKPWGFGPTAAHRLALIAAVTLPALGFALRGSADHLALRDREGGRPMFEPSALEAAGVMNGIVFIDTDHGFNLGHDPGASPAEQVAVLRYRGDDVDAFASARHEGAPSFRYHFDFETGEARVVPYAPARRGVVEAESLWPARDQARGFARPEHDSGECASGGRLLALAPGPDGLADVTLSLPSELAGEAVSPIVWVPAGVAGSLALVADGRPVQTWSLEASELGSCRPLAPAEAPDARDLALIVRSSAGHGLALDALRY